MDVSDKMKLLLISINIEWNWKHPMQFAEEMFYILKDVYFCVKLFSVKWLEKRFQIISLY